ncbi:MAG: CHAD domain-containing protein [Bdellovibrionales bacterium]|nr:CHAD domain-containing protein [Bdellovibrionales bacterium]
MGQPVKTDIASYLLEELKKSFKQHNRAFNRCKKNLTENSVHKLRISSRKLLALCSILERICRDKKSAARVENIVRERLKCLSSLRDIHVMQSTVGLLMGEAARETAFYEELESKENKLSKKAKKHLRTHTLKETKRYQRRLEQQAEQLASIDDAFLSSILCDFVRIAEHEAKQALSECEASDTATIHKARIAFKHYRYLCSAFENALPYTPAFDSAQRTQLQTLMGVIQDLDVLSKRVEASDHKQSLGSLQTALKAALMNRCVEFCTFTQGRISLSQLAAAEAYA